MTNITVVAQNDLVIKYTVTDQDGAVVNLTGATVKWSIRRDLQTLAAISKSTVSGIVVTNAAGGLFEVTLTHTEVAILSREFIMEAVIIDQTGRVYTITDSDGSPDTITFRPIYTEPE